jgi:hypothetical protein
MFVSFERLLSERQIDFDIVTEDAINETLKAGPGTLQTMSGNRYRTLIVPRAQVLSRTTIDKLKAFVAGGGHVLFAGGTPSLIADKTYLDEVQANPEDFSWATVNTSPLAVVPTPPAFPVPVAPGPLNPPAELVAALDSALPGKDVPLATPDTAVRVLQRKLKDATVLMLFNESSNPVKNQLMLNLNGKAVEQWDPQTGGVSAIGGTSRVPLELAPYAATVLVVRQ